MPSRISCRVARGVSPSPHTLSRGNTLFSSSETCRPRRARWVAVAEPAGPAPTTTTSDSTLSARAPPPRSAAARGRPAGGVGVRPAGAGRGRAGVPGGEPPPPPVVWALRRGAAPASRGGLAGARDLLQDLTGVGGELVEPPVSC